jgi:hypothetical protein
MWVPFSLGLVEYHSLIPLTKLGSITTMSMTRMDRLVLQEVPHQRPEVGVEVGTGRPCLVHTHPVIQEVPAVSTP